MNILIIPEDFRNDQYILKPLFKRLFEELGKPRANVEVCRDPLMGGVSEALKKERLEEVFARYDGMIHLYILCVDRDSEAGRRSRLDQLVRELDGPRRFMAENAWEELETWLLAGLDLPREWSWADVRAERDVKERFFVPMAEMLGAIDGPGQGRKALGDLASRRVQAVRQKCPEDFGRLSSEIEVFLAS